MKIQLKETIWSAADCPVFNPDNPTFYSRDCLHERWSPPSIGLAAEFDGMQAISFEAEPIYTR
jgi:hypothetical protein